MQDITIEQLQESYRTGAITLIDVRSPSEFADSTIPGSRNIPLFNDEERAEIGTIYKQVSVEAAKQRGLEIVSAKLPAFIREFAAIPGHKAVFCWRGGMRSKTSATLLGLMDIRVQRLQGGYRAFRQWVVETLAGYRLRSPVVVLSGYTGSGKTALLQRLQGEGYPVVDLEEMAGHRGSVFGQVGLKPHNQKTFEALLVLRLLELEDAPYLLMEAESKRIGKVMVPDFLMEAKAAGTQLFLELPVRSRVRHILEDYEPHKHAQACLDAFTRIKKRIHTPIAAEIQEHLTEARYADAVDLLLAYYYDPMYEHASQQYEEEKLVCPVDTLEEAAEAVRQRLRERFPEYP